MRRWRFHVFRLGLDDEIALPDQAWRSRKCSISKKNREGKMVCSVPFMVACFDFTLGREQGRERKKQSRSKAWFRK